MYGLNEEKNLCEFSYDMADEPLLATLFTTGNGYMGVRGSFEEFGSQRIQGAFVRGFIDEIIEICEPFADNEYMKKYYLDEEKLKSFEKQDSCVNMHDFLLIRIIVGEKTFYPWEGKIVRWKRYVSSDKAEYVREVVWDDGDGNETQLTFKRFASFDNDHVYCQRVVVEPLNHDLPVKIISGIDTYIKTNGQFITKTSLLENKGNDVVHAYEAVNKYKFSAGYHVKNLFPKGKKIADYSNNGCYGVEYSCDKAKSYTFDKITYVLTSRDTSADLVSELYNAFEDITVDFDEQEKRHVEKYRRLLDVADVKIEGDADIDGYLRYATYQTLISAERNDCVHGISAKGLTGERYNQFVWWDAEIHQIPFFIISQPETAKMFFKYRYKTLSQAKINAKENGFNGAKFAFCSSVNGDERVWQYARHPFMQVHINADIPYGIINYYYWTGDAGFMKNCGMEIIHECLRYWETRIVKKGDRYEILKVTGTDEHHPYVDNDAYTNYMVSYVFKEFLFLCESLNYPLTEQEKTAFCEIAEKTYRPELDNGMIPQFDGYFDLSRGLEEAGKGTLKQFQMKKSGLYHKSQVIKQPDVLLLYTMVNVGVNGKYYAQNFDYYEQMCESSSSLTFPVHAIASAQNGRPLSFYKYFSDTLKIDIDDIHGVGWQGVHSGCLAGGYLTVVYGLFGAKATRSGLELTPVKMPFFKGVKAKIVYKGQVVSLALTNEGLNIAKEQGDDLNVKVFGKEYVLKDELAIGFQEL